MLFFFFFFFLTILHFLGYISRQLIPEKKIHSISKRDYLNGISNSSLEEKQKKIF